MFIVTVTCKNSNCQLNSYLFIKIVSYALSPMRDVARDFVCCIAHVLWYFALFRE